jgi:hypothetical protein
LLQKERRKRLCTGWSPHFHAKRNQSAKTDSGQAQETSAEDKRGVFVHSFMQGALNLMCSYLECEPGQNTGVCMKPPVGDVLAGTNSCTNQVKKTPIYTQIHDFIKTDSGQTYEKLRENSKKWRFL